MKPRGFRVKSSLCCLGEEATGLQSSLGLEQRALFLLLELESFSKVIFPAKVPAGPLNLNRYRLGKNEIYEVK